MCSAISSYKVQVLCIHTRWALKRSTDNYVHMHNALYLNSMDVNKVLFPQVIDIFFVTKLKWKGHLDKFMFHVIQV